MGSYAVSVLRQGLGGQAVCARGIEINHIDIQKALDVKRKVTDLYDYLPRLN
jgi:6-phosphofructokinase